jgi:hypothetical protein
MVSLVATRSAHPAFEKQRRPHREPQSRQTKMSAPAPPESSVRRVLKLLCRVLIVIVMATLIGTALDHLAGSVNHSAPAGFGQGALQGAMMPFAMPNLMMGKDVTIYAPDNTGLGYKLGYTVGVNLCGLLFFGLFFYRVRRLLNLRRKS